MKKQSSLGHRGWIIAALLVLLWVGLVQAHRVLRSSTTPSARPKMGELGARCGGVAEFPCRPGLKCATQALARSEGICTEVQDVKLVDSMTIVGSQSWGATGYVLPPDQDVDLQVTGSRVRSGHVAFLFPNGRREDLGDLAVGHDGFLEKTLRFRGGSIGVLEVTALDSDGNQEVVHASVASLQ